ncbi:MAG: diguanylate cyclase [Candidatus Magnetominusculus sp. LBB02]|nr:diguanylate cyclase [Candidatus Magnetominusculus sp. LBB02]
MKVRTRLTFSHAAILATLLAICSISIFMCGNFRDMIHDIVSQRYVKTEYVDNIKDAIAGIDLAISNLMIYDSDRINIIEKIDKNRQSIAENIGRLQPLVKRAEGKQRLRKVIDHQNAYFSLIRQQTNDVLLANSNELKKALLDKQSKNSAEFVQAAEALTEYQKNLMKKGEDDSNLKYKEFFGVAVSVTLGLLLISIFIVIRVIRSLINELGAEPRDINMMLSDIADGKIHDDYALLRGEGQKGIIKYIGSMLDSLRERDMLVQNELALGEELSARNFIMKQREILQDTIQSVLEISLEQAPLNVKLARVLDIIVSIPGMSIEHKGCIHLKVDGADELQMVAERNLPESLLSQCARLKYGQCLCGIAASTHKTIFSNCLDDLHTVRFEGMHEHGHYCIPIKSGNIFLGVLCLYVKHNHERSREEESAFSAITNSIAAMIESGKREDDIRRINKFTSTVINSIKDSILVIDVKDFTIVSTNKAFLREYRLLESEVVGEHCYALTHEATEPCNQHERSCPVMTMMRTGEYAVSEHVHHDHDGKEIYVSCSASPIKDEAGNIVQCVYVLNNISQRKYYEKQLQQLAHYDVVTSLPNRILLLDRLNIAIEFTAREGNKMALLFIDLDKFKAVNDTYGHETGDGLLKEVSKRLLGAVRKSDTVSRVGGDEFVIVLTKVTGKEDAGAIADKIIAALNKPFFVNGNECRIGGSIGIEIYPFSGVDSEIENVPDMLVKRADMAMYRAKELGKNRYEFYSGELVGDTKNPLFDSPKTAQAG